MHVAKSIIGPGLAIGLVATGTLFSIPIAYGGVTLPDCAGLQQWIATVDPKTRWNPVDGSRAWLPAAFEDPSFSETFGAAPLDWTRAEASEAAKRLFECGNQAGETGDRKARTAFYGARGWFKNNLQGVLVAQARATALADRKAEQTVRREELKRQDEARMAAEQQRREQRRQVETDRMDALQAALDDVINQPDSPSLLQSLIVLRDTNPRDALAVNSVIARYGPEAGTLLGQARYLKLRMRDDPIGPALDGRIDELRSAIAGEYTERIDALTAAEPGALQYLARWEREVREQFADALGPQLSSNLLAHVAERRELIEDDMLAGLIMRIDGATELPDATDALARVQESINLAHQGGLSPERQARLRAHAAKVEARLAEKAVVEAEADLAGVAEDLDGLRFLLNTIPRADRPPLSRAPQAVLASYREAAHRRLDEVATGAFAAFEAGLDEVPDSPQGLQRLERTMVSDAAFSLLSPPIRADYEEAVQVRRNQIRTALGEAEKEARRASIARGGDTDLIGHVFENAETGLAVGFLDEQRAVVGLNGKEDMAPYKLQDNQVLVYGKGMTLRFNRSGTGQDTTLEWLGKTLKRFER